MQESRIETQQSIRLDSRFSRGLKNRVSTYFWTVLYCKWQTSDSGCKFLKSGNKQIKTLQNNKTRGACNRNLQVITPTSHVCSQHSFGLSLRMYGMQRTPFDHAHLDLPSLVIWSSMFWPSVTWNLCKAQHWSKSVLTFDCCRLHSITFGYY